jgi:hypothetical protein
MYVTARVMEGGEGGELKQFKTAFVSAGNQSMPEDMGVRHHPKLLNSYML